MPTPQNKPTIEDQLVSRGLPPRKIVWVLGFSWSLTRIRNGYMAFKSNCNSFTQKMVRKVL